MDIDWIFQRSIWRYCIQGVQKLVQIVDEVGDLKEMATLFLGMEERKKLDCFRFPWIEKMRTLLIVD